MLVLSQTFPTLLIELLHLNRSCDQMAYRGCVSGSLYLLPQDNHELY